MSTPGRPSVPVSPHSTSDEVTKYNNRISLASLHILSAIGRTGSISSAARSLGLSQPAVSASIRNLERHTGLPLLNRTSRGSQLSERGLAVAALAQAVLDASDKFESDLMELSASTNKHLRIAASMTIAEYLVPRWLASWHRARHAFQDPAVELLVRNSTDVVDAVCKRSVELGFIEGDGRVTPDLKVTTVAHDELVVVVAPNHPWARRRATVGPADLANTDLILREQGSGTRQVLERSLAAAGQSLRADLSQFGSTAAVKAAVVAESGVGVLSALTVTQEIEHGILVRVRTTELNLRRPLRMVVNRSVTLGRAAADFASVVRSMPY